MSKGRRAGPGPATTPDHRWWNTAGAWLAIGTSPAALVLGVGIADRHDGPMPVVALALGGVAMSMLLLLQGRLGLRPPGGECRALSAILDVYLPRRDRTIVSTLLALAMVGWLGFNAALGGAAVASLLGTPRWIGVTVLGVPLLILALGGQRRWNGLAVVTTVAALTLVVLVALQRPHASAPVSWHVGPPGLLLADAAVFVGYVAVFAVRAPDFTVGLRGRSDLWVCAAVLVVPTLVAAAAGATVAARDGAPDLIAHLRSSDLGTTLVAIAVMAPALTAYHSGGLALRAVTRLSARWSTVVVGVAGLALAMSGFERVLVPWLTVLAAVLPPLVIPMAVEARVRRTRPARVVRATTWLPAAAVGLTLTVVGVSGAALAGLAIAAVVTAAVRGVDRAKHRVAERREAR